MAEGPGILTVEEHRTKREIISAVTFQFSAPIQRLKTHSLGQVFLKLLFEHRPGEYVPIGRLRREFTDAVKGGHISEYDAGQVLQRLVSENKVSSACDGSTSFCLKERTRTELERIEFEAERELDRVLDLFFTNGMTQAAVYREGLISIVSRVAATMGEESASYLLRRRIDIPYDPDVLDKWIAEISSENPRIDPRVLRIGVVDFFKSTDSFVQSLLWQITEAYFVTRMLGMDSAGNSLSREVFRRAEFVLDTNVVLALIIGAAEDHDLALATIKAIRSLNLPLIVSLGTLDEAKSVVDREIAKLAVAVSHHQDGLLERSDSPVLREFARRGRATIDDFHNDLKTIDATLVQKYGVDIRGFRRPTEQQDYAAFVDELRVRYQKGNPNRRLKSEAVAEHDADLLLLVQERRVASERESWLLTLDTSLPGAVPPGSSDVSLALSPKTVIQWLAPVVNQSSLKDEFPKVFAEMVRGRFLPRTHFLTDGDLSVLVHFQEVIDQLHEDDVDRAVTKFMAETTRADLTEAEGILAFSGIVQSVVSEPSSRYQSALQDHRSRHEQIEQELTAISQKAEELARQRAAEQMAAEDAIQTEKHHRKLEEEAFRRREGILRFWVFMVGLILVCTVLFFFGLSAPVLDRLGTLQLVFVEVIVLGLASYLLVNVALPSAVGQLNIPHMGPNYRRITGK